MTSSAAWSCRFPAPTVDVAARPGHPPSWAPVGIGRSDGTVVVTLSGVLDASGAGWLEHLLRDVVEDQGNQFVAVDLRAVGGADAAVLAVLVAFSGRAARRGGRLVVLEPQAAVLAELGRAGLDGALEVVPRFSPPRVASGDPRWSGSAAARPRREDRGGGAP